MTAPPRAVVAFGDGALLVETSGVEQAGALARAVVDRARDGQAPVGIDEAVVGFGNVVIVLDLSLDGTDPDRCAAWVEHLLTELCTGGGVPPVTPDPTTGQTHVLPVVFDGTDLDEVARRTGTSTDRVVAWLCGADLRVAFLGFAPGFPYLTGLPAELAALPRRDTPRTSVPAGSVAIGGGFASVYPRASPGGWHLLGRTDVRLFDPDVAPYALVHPGDRVHFTVAAGAARAREPRPGPRPPLGAGDRDHLEILDPGVLSLIQDGGRRAVASLGIPRGGAADPEALVLANRLTGNPDTAAVVECTAVGPTVRIAGGGHLAVVGAGPRAVDVLVDGHPVDSDTVLPVADGQIVSVGRIHRGLRAYLAVAGGLETPLVIGGRASDLLSGLGPGPLRAGDRLARGRPGPVRGALSPPPSTQSPGTGSGVTVLRALAGPHPTSQELLDRLSGTVWRIGSRSDRIGLRLEASGERLPVTDQTASTGMVTGAVQIPPDGTPIVLLPDHATVGGYPVAACVIAADLPILGRLSPGDRVALRLCGRHEARTALERSRRELDGRVSGWYPTAAGT